MKVPSCSVINRFKDTSMPHMQRQKHIETRVKAPEAPRTHVGTFDIY